MRVLRLTGQDIDGDDVSCTGAQLAIVLSACAEFGDLAGCRWYAADVTPAYEGELAAYEDGAARLVGTVERLIGLLQGPRQFDSGLFVAMPGPEWPDIVAEGVGMDGPPRRQVPFSEVEVLAFDDSYIEVVTGRDDVLAQLLDRFGGQVLSLG